MIADHPPTHEQRLAALEQAVVNATADVATNRAYFQGCKASAEAANRELDIARYGWQQAQQRRVAAEVALRNARLRRPA